MLPAVDTIVALSTPPGRGGIGVIRLSGPASIEIARTLLCDPSFSPEPNHSLLRKVFDPDTRTLLDHALITYFQAPHSFTGEDVIEFSCHGSPVLLRSIIDMTLRLNARLADRGEFTLRAVGNGKIDLTQAEALRDLIDAQTSAALQQASRQMDGEVSHVIRPVRDRLLDLIVRLESSLEFVEDDLDPIETQQLGKDFDALFTDLSNLAKSFSAGRLLRDGIRVALLGRPNVGKSSLFNGLLRLDRAIVTELPGTTRDTLSETIDIQGIAVHLTDTAGVRQVPDPIEFLGVDRARRAVADADLTIVVFDGSEDLRDDDWNLLRDTERYPRIVVMNKNDLSSFQVDRVGNRKHSNSETVVSVSAKTEAGLDQLRAAIIKPFLNGQNLTEGLLLTNARHHDLLVRSLAEIRSSSDLLAEGSSEELILVGLHNALNYLGEILGEITTDDILARIFSTFCIGK